MSPPARPRPDFLLVISDLPAFLDAPADADEDAPRTGLGHGPFGCTLCGYGATTAALLGRHTNSRLCRRRQVNRLGLADNVARTKKRSASTVLIDSSVDEIEDVVDEDYDEKAEDKEVPARKRARREPPAPAPAEELNMARLLGGMGMLNRAIKYEKSRNELVRRHAVNTQALERNQLTFNEATRAKEEAVAQQQTAKNAYDDIADTFNDAVRDSNEKLTAYEDALVEYDNYRERADHIVDAAHRLRTDAKEKVKQMRDEITEGFEVVATVSLTCTLRGVPVTLPDDHDDLLAMLAPTLKRDLAEANERIDTTRDASTAAGVLVDELDDTVEKALHERGVASETVSTQTYVANRAHNTMESIREVIADIDRLLENTFTTPELNNTGEFGKLPEDARRLVRQLRAAPDHNKSLIKDLFDSANEFTTAVPTSFVTHAPFVLNEKVLNRAHEADIVLPDDVCVICYTDLNDAEASAMDPIVRAPCSHFFHASCINGMFIDSSAAYNNLATRGSSTCKCPTCRAEIKTTHLVLVSPTRFFF